MAITNYDDASLAREMADASTPLVIDVHAPWCGYCTRMAPDLERLAEERAGSIRFAKIDQDDYPEIALTLGVKTLPLIVLMVDGKEVARRGSGDHQQLTDWLAEHSL